MAMFSRPILVFSMFSGRTNCWRVGERMCGVRRGIRKENKQSTLIGRGGERKERRGETSQQVVLTFKNLTR